MGVFMMLAGTGNALLAGWLGWPLYAALSGIPLWMAGCALRWPTPFALQRQRGGLPTFLGLLAIVVLMAWSFLYVIGLAGATLTRQFPPH